MTRSRTMIGLLVALLSGVALPVAQAAQTDAASGTKATAASSTSVQMPAPVASTTSSPLDGTEWPVKVTPNFMAAQHGEKLFDDAFVFANGKVTLTACAKSGFAPSAYDASPTGPSAWKVMTKQESPTAGKTAWIGMIHGDAITGTLAMTKKDGTIEHYTFEGKRTANKTS